MTHSVPLFRTVIDRLINVIVLQRNPNRLNLHEEPNITIDFNGEVCEPAANCVLAVTCSNLL